MGIFSALIGAGSSALSQAMSYQYQKKLMKYQYGLERESRQTAFGDTRQSLEDAGYNPMLATGVQSSSLTPSSTAPSAPDPASMVSALTASRAQKDEEKRNEVLNEVDRQRAGNEARVGMQQEALLRSQTDNQLIKNNIDQLTGLAIAEANLEDIRTHSAYQKQQIDNLKQDIIESGSRITKNIAQATEAYSGSELNSAQTALSKEEQYTKRLYNLDEQEFRDYLEQHPNQRNIRYFGRATGITAGDAVKAGGTVGGAYILRGSGSTKKFSAKSGRR